MSTQPWRSAERLAWRAAASARGRSSGPTPLGEVHRGLQPGLAQVGKEEPA